MASESPKEQRQERIAAADTAAHALIAAAGTAGRMAQAWAERTDPDSRLGEYQASAANASSLAETARRLAEAAELLARAGRA